VVSNKRKGKQTNDQTSSKRQRVTKTNWVTKIAAIISSPSFHKIQTEVYKETLVEIAQLSEEFNKTVVKVTSTLAQKILTENNNNFEQYIIVYINTYHANGATPAELYVMK
jgi:D-ribose pyranose/furanose isomerase RbsD